MGVLTDEQLEQVWEDQGLKHHIKRFYKYLADRGLLPMSVPEDIFSDHIRNNILRTFFVKGVKELPDGRQRTVRNRTGKDASASGKAPAPSDGSSGTEA